jgi:hypothetical protein
MCSPKIETSTLKMRANLLSSVRLLHQSWMVDEPGTLVEWYG